MRKELIIIVTEVVTLIVNLKVSDALKAKEVIR